MIGFIPRIPKRQVAYCGDCVHFVDFELMLHYMLGDYEDRVVLICKKLWKSLIKVDSFLYINEEDEELNEDIALPTWEGTALCLA